MCKYVLCFCSFRRVAPPEVLRSVLAPLARPLRGPLGCIYLHQQDKSLGLLREYGTNCGSTMRKAKKEVVR